MIGLLGIVIVLLLGITGSASAHAMQADGTRYSDALCSGQTYNTHWEHGEVVVYINISALNGVQLLHTPNGLWSSSEIAGQVQSVVNDFNTQVGASVRLRYAGTTTALTIAGAIVIRSNPTAASPLAVAGVTYNCVLNFRGQILSAYIDFMRTTSSGADRVFASHPDYSSSPDFSSVLAHELGHALGLAHSNDAVLQDTGGFVYPSSTQTTMYSGYRASRDWTRYEKDTLKNLYFVRTSAMKFFYSGQSKGHGASWATRADALSDVMIAGGRASEGATHIVFGYSGPAWPQVRGIVWQKPRTLNQFSFPNSFETLSAPSFAYGNGEFRAYWLEADPPVLVHPPYLAWYGTKSGKDFRQKRIHWMSSVDAQTWTYQGVLSDPATGLTIYTVKDDVSVAYDSQRKIFAVIWLDANYNARLMTMPGPGSLQAGNVYTVLPFSYWRTPAMSCASTSSGCQMVAPYKGTPSGDAANAPFLVTMHGAFATNGTLSISSTWFNTTIATSQVASVAYAPSDDGWVLGYLGIDGYSIYTSRKTVESAAWPVPTGPIYGNGSRALSSPSLGYSTESFGRIGLSVVAYGP
ncbi:MAG: Matrixin [Myxococcales bacterium]|nr:Matrixin [Myxococcales bacterium]